MKFRNIFITFTFLTLNDLERIILRFLDDPLVLFLVLPCCALTLAIIRADGLTLGVDLRLSSWGGYLYSRNIPPNTIRGMTIQGNSTAA